MIPKVIEIPPLAIHLYGIIIALAIFIGWLVAKKRAHLYQIPKALFDDPVLLVPLILAILGARLYHVLDYWSFYSKNPYSIINIPNGGLGIWGAIGGVILGFWIVAKVKKLHFWSVLDLASPSLILGQAIGRFGNFVNQEAFGPPTNLPWGIFIDPGNRPAQFASSTHFHPTFFYEAILDAIFFVILIYTERRADYSSNLSTDVRDKLGREVMSSWSGNDHDRISNLDSISERSEETSSLIASLQNDNRKFSINSNNNQQRFRRGQLFALYLILYSTARFIVEFWRIDTATIGTIKLAHLLSIFALVIGIFLLIKLKVRQD